MLKGGALNGSCAEIIFYSLQFIIIVYLRQGHLITGYFRKRIFIKCKYINNLCVTALSHVYLWNKLNEKL